MSEQLYSLLLRLYPRVFRARYADEMMRVFRERFRDEGAARVWPDVLADAAVSVPLQHIEARSLRAISSASPVAAGIVWSVRSLSPRRKTRVMLIVLSSAALLFGTADWNSAIYWCLSIVVFGSALLRARAIGTYHVEIADDTVTVACERLGLPPTTLHFSEVTGVQLLDTLGLRIRTADPARDLFVPSNAPMYATVRDRLSHYVPVTIPSRHLTLRA
jgi:hypothetical protein